MKFFKKKNQKQTEEEEGIVDGMPAPPTVPNQDPRHTQRNVNPPKGRQVDPRYSQQELKQDPRYSQQQQDRRYIQQQQDPRYSPQQQQEPPRYSPQQDPRYHQQKDPRYSQQQVHHRQSNQNRPPQQSDQEGVFNVPPPPREQQASPHSPPRSSSPPESEATQTPPKKEKAAPTAIGIDPALQAERAAITRELVKQYVADVWNRGDLELIPKLCSRGLRFNGSAGMDRVGHDGFARMVQTIRASLEDYHCEIHSMVVEGNKAFCRMRFTGRHVGQLLGYEATGKHVSWMGASEFTVVDGLIVKVWELGDMASLEHQLRQAKAVPPPIAVEGEC